MKRLLIPLLTLWCTIACAQTDCHIGPVFGRYAVWENATEVQMSGKALKAYRLKVFHSLEIRQPAASTVADIEQQVRADARGQPLGHPLRRAFGAEIRHQCLAHAETSIHCNLP